MIQRGKKDEKWRHGDIFVYHVHTHKVSDTESLPYTKGDVRVLLHVGHVTLKRLLVSATLKNDVIKTEGADDTDGFFRVRAVLMASYSVSFALCEDRGRMLLCIWTAVGQKRSDNEISGTGDFCPPHRGRDAGGPAR